MGTNDSDDESNKYERAEQRMSGTIMSCMYTNFDVTKYSLNRNLLYKLYTHYIVL